MRQGVFLAYLILLHALLGLTLWKSDFLARVTRKLSGRPPVREITDHYRTMVRYHARMDETVPDGSVLFIGDSLIEGLCPDAVICPSVNYGIGNDTTVGVIRRLGEYHSLARASAVVLAIGGNDMKFRDNQHIVQNYRRILQMLPSTVPIVCSAVLPVNEARYSGPAGISNARILDINASLRTLCSEDKHRLFVDVGRRLVEENGSLAPAFHEGDGVHFNKAGTEIWINEMRAAVRQVAASVDAKKAGPKNALISLESAFRR